MPAFSRGCVGFIRQSYFHLPPSLRIAALPCRAQTSYPADQARYFSSSILRQLASPKTILKPARSAQKVQLASKQAAKSKPANPPPPRFPSSNPVLRSVEAQKSPTLLYEAPPRGILIMATYSAAFMLTSGAVWTFNNMYLNLPAEQPFWVGPVYGVIAFLLAGLGMYVIASPVGLVRSIQAVPGRAGTPVKLRIEAKIMVVERGEAILSARVAPMALLFRAVNEQKLRNLRVGLENKFVLFRPFIITGRWLSRLMFKWFINTRMAFTRFGVVYLDVGNKRWKVDTSGWLLDEGRVLDKLIGIV
ncbi:uncharacterized protein K441DRAFT_691409 [Cenococcum geophilum 1.58]|uniref:Uncharacterized protein n=1 Tax=Cenococcum geophilum 1.58 TaxID=794803 RepID=A0ACC8EL69_9PEZI|nr:hypothetical protein K441DRAFT_691409 [Cenococcum geophilum 1.58]